jgi:hypothetical protein
MNITFSFADSYDVVRLHVNFAIPKDKRDQNYERTIMQSSINVCRMFNNVTGDFISRMIMEYARKSCDFELKCPIMPVR